LSTGHADRRVCILTGASGQLGTHFCNQFSDRYEIVAVYRRNRPQVPTHDSRVVDPLDPDGSADAANSPSGDPNGSADSRKRPVFAVLADVTEERECDRVVELALARYDRVDLVVNAAVYSIWSTMLGSDQLRRSAQHQFVTNVVAPLNMATAVARQFWQGRDTENRERNRNVVNISSVAGLRIYGGLGQSIYAASKAALNQLTGHMAAEFAPLGVRVNATAANSFPSIVPTSRAADAIVRLDEGSENGVIVVVDGAEDTVVQLHPYQQLQG
jgi:NAD(P)-dependent dehydrogenase (short-subunit alcohol dehydrogenase family)